MIVMLKYDKILVSNIQYLVGKQGERGEAKISHRQTRLNAVDER